MNSISSPTTPLTLLTGFLGAGKTSLLNNILRAEHGLRIAVLVNDFGALNIDAELIAQVEPTTIRLSNGCVCCSIRGDLLAAVLELLARPEPADYIILECSGVADPVSVARTFLLPQLRDRIRLDSTITVVDASSVHERDEAQDLIADQIAAADIVLLNKIDLASENLRSGLHNWITMIVPNARVIETVHAQAPLEHVLGVGAFGQVFEQPEHKHFHTDQFASWSFTAEQPFMFYALRRALDSLPSGIMRIKGVLWVKEEPARRIELQGVGRRISLTPSFPWNDQLRVSQLVLIGTPASVDPVELTKRFSDCLDKTFES